MSEDRSTAMLTKTQRAFLKGEKEYTGDHAKQQRYQRRKAIKERVENTLLDFQLLFETWDERGSGELFGEDPARGETGRGISTLLALLYLETYDGGQFEQLLYRGVNQAEEQIHPGEGLLRVDFEVERMPTVDMEDAIRRYRRRGNLSDMNPYELAAVAEVLRREEHVEGGGSDAARAAAKAWEKRESDIQKKLDDDGEE
jgi:hypothetical protein